MRMWLLLLVGSAGISNPKFNQQNPQHSSAELTVSTDSVFLLVIYKQQSLRQNKLSLKLSTVKEEPSNLEIFKKHCQEGNLSAQVTLGPVVEIKCQC